MDDERRDELKNFLRDRRGRIMPDGSTPSKTRRRTPGLRREEVAKLAGVSLAWYSWLEMGRNMRMSSSALGSIAHALRLNADERSYLFHLAGVPEQSIARTRGALSPVVAAVLAGFETGPAFVINGRWDVLELNKTAAALYGFAPSARGYARNLMWRMFTDEPLRRLHVEPKRIAAQMVAIFRLSLSSEPENPEYRALVNDLTKESAEFRKLWSTYSVQSFRPTHAVINHPKVGRLSLDFISFAIPQSDRQSIVFHVPTPGTDTERRLAKLLT